MNCLGSEENNGVVIFPNNISMIMAVSDNGVIGANNTLPWKVPEDMTYFKKMTIGKPIIMGRKTAESLKRPLPNRLNIVLTKNRAMPSGFIVVSDADEALEIANEHNFEIMIIGGAQIYNLFSPIASSLYLNRIHQTVVGDSYFSVGEEWLQVYCKSVAGVCSFCKFEKREHDHEI